MSSLNTERLKSEMSVAPLTQSEVETVSVVIPCFNEERFIGKALEQLADQYDPARYEIIVVDGLSVDRTRQVIEAFREKHPELSIKLVDNPARVIPTALNLGVTAATGSIIARMDAHAVPSSGYIKRCVEVIEQGTAGVVGMPCRVISATNGTIARAIAGAVSHPFGIGDAKYRLSEGGPLQEPVDTVAFACFRKSLWQELGGFNESLLTNEDYDFNFRVRRSGKEVILDRSGHCDYFARGSLKGLAAQYFRYGGWKAEMIRLHPSSTRMRHLVAPVFVISIIVLAVLGLFWPVFWWFLLAELGLYLLFALVGGWQIARKAKGGLGIVLVMPLVFATIHLMWGSSFLLRLCGIRI